MAEVPRRSRTVPILLDTAHALLTNKIMPKARKAMNMRFRWLKCQEGREKFRYYWRPGTQKLADYFTKHHPPSHHIAVRPTILTPTNDPEYTKLLVKPKDAKHNKTSVANNAKHNKTSVTNAFTKHLLNTPAFQTMIATSA